MDDWSKVPVFGARSAPEAYVIRPGAYGLVEDDRGRLAVARTPQGLYLPGGGIEAGETPEEAVVREVREECGLGVRLGAWTARAVQFCYSVSDRAHYEKLCTFIDGTAEGPASAPSEADHELVWIPLETAARILAHESHGWAVERWRSREE
jgi:8-oxo-dGTP diphosphatase